MTDEQKREARDALEWAIEVARAELNQLQRDKERITKRRNHLQQRLIDADEDIGQSIGRVAALTSALDELEGRQ